MSSPIVSIVTTSMWKQYAKLLIGISLDSSWVLTILHILKLHLRKPQILIDIISVHLFIANNFKLINF